MATFPTKSRRRRDAHRRVRLLVEILATAVTAALLLPVAAADAHPRTPGFASDSSPAVKYATQPALRPTKTTLTIKLTHCVGCTLHLFGDYRDGYHHWDAAKTPRPTKHGRISKTVVRLAPQRTRGLVVLVNDPRAVDTGSGNLTVMRYAGLAVGARVPRGHRDTAGHACWAGTSAKRVLLDIRIARYPASDVVTGEDGYAIAPFLNRGVRSIGPRKRTTKGVALKTRDVEGYCGR
jgi:hypothetical protein